MTTVIINARLCGESSPDTWILIDDDTIKDVGYGQHPHVDKIIDAKGALAMPGAIDCHVHFREPGMTQKADIESESRAAVAGGVTSYLEMPNTKPATTTIRDWQAKMDIAAQKSLANYAFFIGATNDNIDQLLQADYTHIPGVKLFMGSSTGNMLVDDNSAISTIFKEIPALVAVHAESQDIIDKNIQLLTAKGVITDGDAPVRWHSVIRSAQACYESSLKAATLARETGHRLHLCHLTTADELSLLSKGQLSDKLITAEVSPHHLMWCDADYDTKGTRIKMNPAVKTAADRDALRQALIDGIIDIVATDHAPHLMSDKQGGALKATSGAPLVQFALPWMLSNFPEQVVIRSMCENPAKLYGITRRGAIKPGYYADIALIDKVEPYTITDDDVVSKCHWTPAQGVTINHRVRTTIVNGVAAYDNGTFAHASSAMPLIFNLANGD